MLIYSKMVRSKGLYQLLVTLHFLLCVLLVIRCTVSHFFIFFHHFFVPLHHASTLTLLHQRLPLHHQCIVPHCIISELYLIASSGALTAPTLAPLHPVQHMWLFFEMILKSVPQYLKKVGKLDKLVSVRHCTHHHAWWTCRFRVSDNELSSGQYVMYVHRACSCLYRHGCALPGSLCSSL